MLFTHSWQASLQPLLVGADKVMYFLDPAIVHAINQEILSRACTYNIDATSSPNETNKTLQQVEHVWRELYGQGATRKSVLVVIGGGTVMDIGGFAASTYKRGIRCVYVPTTLLGMVDASMGGKTGFDYMGVKNLVGTFAQPTETIVDTAWLTTLPYEEFLSGYAEMVKHGLLCSEQMWSSLLASDCMEDIEAKIRQSVAFKQQVVAADPRESGYRKVLNFGHTVGHALEAYSLQQAAHEPLRHGYAVMQGMVAALYLSVVLCGMDRSVLRTMSHFMVEHYGRARCACNDYEQLLALMRQDKKNERSGEIGFTLLKKIGDPVINKVATEDAIREALDYLFSI